MSVIELSTTEKTAYLIKPILIALQNSGGQLERSEIKEKICEMDEAIAEFAEVTKVSKETGKEYKEFNWKFNFALNGMSVTGYVQYEKTNPLITLTEKGRSVDVKALEVEKEIIEPARKYWKETRKNSKMESSDDNEMGSHDPNSLEDEFDDMLSKAIAEMSPKKFEAFSRSLLKKMGVDFTEKGVQVSNDGGIDGYGYHVDKNDFRTTRVVIQCKRYNSAPVGEPEVNQFLGAMNKFQADYGVFITNGRFTSAARYAAREGSPITLIDGNELLKLVKEYKLYIKEVVTYVLDDFYLNE